jgi:hypothetical protein
MTICGPKNDELRRPGELHSETRNVYFYFSSLKRPKIIESYIILPAVSYVCGTSLTLMGQQGLSLFEKRC